MTMNMKEIIDLIAPRGYRDICGLVHEINEKSDEAVRNLRVNGKSLKHLSKSKDSISLDT